MLLVTEEKDVINFEEFYEVDNDNYEYLKDHSKKLVLKESTKRKAWLS